MWSRTAADAAARAAARLRLRAAGRRALRLAAGGELRVIARFERSAYVADAAGDLACLGGDGLGLGPLNATVGDGFERARLAVGDRVALDAAAATLWQPRRFAAPAGDGLQRAVAALSEAMTKVAPRGLMDPAGGSPATTRARGALAALGAWIASDRSEPPDEIAALIGLGPGLTPAGDDALGGAMIALRVFGRHEAADRLAQYVLPPAATRTSVISLAHLAAAAAGEGAAALHDTLAAIVEDDRDATLGALRRLDRLGHSSGWDALAGADAILRGLGQARLTPAED